MANSQCPTDIDHGDKLQTVLETASGLAAVCFNVECPSNFAFFRSIYVNKEAVCRLLGSAIHSKWLDDMVVVYLYNYKVYDLLLMNENASLS